MKTISQLGSTAVEWATHAEWLGCRVISITVSAEGARILLSAAPSVPSLSAAIGHRVGRGVHWDLEVDPGVVYTWVEGGEHEVVLSWADR